MSLSFGSIASIPASRLFRYGRDISLGWEHDSDTTGPFAAGEVLVDVDVTAGADMYIYGFLITAGESNAFHIYWENNGTAYSYLIDFPSDGTVQYTDFVPINEGLPANRRANSTTTTVSIKTINAGSAGVRYAAGLLVGEVKQE